MRFRLLRLLILASVVIFPECSQRGCPGGMCPPDHYYSANRRAVRRSMRYNADRPAWLSFRREGTNWSRSRNQNKISRRTHNIERRGATMRLSKKGNYRSNINSQVYVPHQEKNRQSKYLNRKRIKSRRGGHQEGLWSPEVQNWKAHFKPKKKKQHRQKVKTKKLD